MSDSLRDQLVKVGLVNKSSASVQSAKARKKHKKPATPSDASLEAKKKAEEKRERDKVLNAEIQAKQAKAALKARIKELILAKCLAEYAGEISHNYIMGSKVRRLFVNQTTHDMLAGDKLAITRLNGKTFIVPVDTATKILALNPEWAMSRPGQEKEHSVNEEYAEYTVPDDLTW